MTTPYTERITEKERELAIATADMLPIQQRVNQLERELDRLRSLEWIQSNGVTKDNIELSSGEGKPYFTMVHDFIKWLSANSTKPFAEWNTRICRTQDLINGTASLWGPGRVEDLQ